MQTRAERYSRQTALPGFDSAAQERLRAARILVIGAGGLGSGVIPALAAAGVGAIGIVDDDAVELSNLHRQLIHGIADVGTAKARSAANAVAAIDPETAVVAFESRLDSSNALELFGNYDLVIDGSDNFPTRYLTNDAAAIRGIPLVWGAVSQYSGQAGVAWSTRGPGYRDLFPTPPPPGSVLSCEAGGVFPTVVAVIAGIMAGEALKILTGVGKPLIGRVTTFESLTGTFRELAYDRDPSAEPVTELVDYDLLCGMPTDTMSVEELSGTLKHVTLLDVREPWEARLAELPGSVNIPLGSLESGGGIGGLDLSKPLVVYCHVGVRSARAVELLRARGIAGARSLTGGIDAWSLRIDATVARY
jgi:adenylyltransferase/sulfurtransferase